MARDLRHFREQPRRSGRLLTLVASVLLAACVAPQARIDGAGTVSAATQLRDWSASGRLGVIAPTQSGSGSFVWQQQAQNSRIQLRGPAGIGALQIEFDGQALQLTGSDGMRYATDDALPEMERRLGVRLPVQQLRFWFIGLPAPGAFEWSAEESGKVLQQDGWRIRYQSMMQQGELTLPQKLVLTRDGVQIRVLVERWQLSPP